jgi:TIR domain
MDDRDHLFISYAWENQAFARWLALRLTSEGYKVWIDQFKLLGGESWPRDIDTAIKTRTFRVLGLLSKHSIAKPNPLKERTLALNIAKQPGMQGFLIPLNVDGLSPVELDWLTSDITFIPFTPSWATGLSQLLKLLEREHCPKSIGDGRAIACMVDSDSEVVQCKPDLLTSNAQRFLQVPTHLTTFIVDSKFDHSDAADAKRDWPFYTIAPHRVVAFHPPGNDLATWLRVDAVRTTEWRKISTVENVNSENVVSALLRASIETRCRLRGLAWSADAKAYYFQGSLSQDVPVRLPSGVNTRVQHSGQRTYFRIGQPKMPYRYRIAAKPSVERGLLAEFSLVWRLRFHFTDINDVPLPATQRQSRRKHLTRNWFNHHWLVRQLAVMQYLADADGMIRIGPAGSQQVILDCAPLSFVAPKAIDEDKLDQLEEIGDEVPVKEEATDGDDDGTDEK